MALKFWVDVRQQIVMSHAGEELFSLSWQSPRDDVSIKILVVLKPYKMVTKTSNGLILTLQSQHKQIQDPQRKQNARSGPVKS